MNDSDIPIQAVVLIVLAIMVIVIVAQRVTQHVAPSHPESSCFFDTTTTYPDLVRLLDVDEVREELRRVSSDNLWVPWPEPLANQPHKWTTLPLYGFGHFSRESASFPHLTQRLRQLLPRLKLATFSRLSPRTRLGGHYGWASHSNHVLRSHLLLSRPRRHGQCALHVEREMHVYDRVGEWITFDDAKYHWARNDDDRDDRIVLIVDMERPSYVPLGQSTSPDSSELHNFVREHAVDNDFDDDDDISRHLRNDDDDVTTCQSLTRSTCATVPRPPVWSGSKPHGMGRRSGVSPIYSSRTAIADKASVPI